MTISDTTTIDVRRADTRFRARLPWLDSRHSFSFGHHRDPSNTHHGLLPGNNDDVVLAGAGRPEEGDAARLTAAGSPQVVADAERGAEVLIWETRG